MAFQIHDRCEDGHNYIEVTNAKGERLFCSMTRETAVKIIERDHAHAVAVAFKDPANAPLLEIST